MSIFENGNNNVDCWLNDSDNKKAMDSLRYNFGALGYIVPNFRRENANKFLKDIGVKTEDRFSIIQKACDCILRDNPHSAMDEISKEVDVTGTYTVMSYLLTGDSTKE